jgi:ABC-type bacteriocin/lantibiotic exporter with double-glycine peptidase domain
MDAPIIRVIPQRAPADCGVACLAMICGVTYENALVAVAQVQPNVCVKGLWVRELKAAAKLLGYRLRMRRGFDLETDTGILNLSSKKWTCEHVVILREGMVIETDGTLWEADLYLRQHRARMGSLLIAEAA